MRQHANIIPIELSADSPRRAETLERRRSIRAAIEHGEQRVRDRLRAAAPSLAPAALALIYIWFGAIKLIGASPATPLVIELQRITLPMLDPTHFLLLLGFCEVAIGALLLSARWRTVGLLLFAGHMATTLLPLVLLPDISWQAPLVPTLEGQYIIKNVALIATGVGIAAGFRAPERGAKPPAE